jgi:phage shock protein C
VMEDIRTSPTTMAKSSAGDSVQKAVPEPPRSPWSRTCAWLRNFERERQGAYLAGICAGLGKHTPVPAWCWRIILILGLIANGLSFNVGGWFISLYLLLWITVPKSTEKTEGH